MKMGDLIGEGMRGYLKLSALLGSFVLQVIPLILEAQSLYPMPAPPDIRNKALPASTSMGPPGNRLPLPPSDIQSQESFVQIKPSPEIDRSAEILDFWFGFIPGPDFFPENKMPVWFAITPEIDRQIRDNFTQDVLNAQRGDYNQWRETPRGRLALILLLDQFPRHIYRNQPQAFTLDRMAQALVLEGIQKGDDKHLYPIERAFFYLPLEHAEDLNMQNMSINSFRQLVLNSPESIQPQMQDFLQAAIMHQQQIARFGRFPHRNTILRRESTPEETVFLMQWKKR